MAKVDFVYVECSFVALYEGQALVGEVISLLGEHGLVAIDIADTSRDRHTGRVIQADILFGRRSDLASC